MLECRALAVGLAAGESEPCGLQVEHVTSEDVARLPNPRARVVA